MWNKLRELSELYKHERKGFIGFCFILLLITTFNWSLDYWVEAPDIDVSQFEKYLVDSGAVALNQQEVALTVIDVNSSDLQDWSQFGISKAQFQSILNYKESLGGKFETIKALKNCYVIDSAKYAYISPYLKVDLPVDITVVESNEPVVESATYMLFNFNPNHLSEDSLYLLGLTKNQVDNIINYRTKGGIFSEIADLEKMYTISSIDIQRLKAYLKFNSESVDINKRGNLKSTGTNYTLDLNRCDSLDLLGIKGIGPYYSSRILGYRKRLGGYISVDQLFEVKGIPDSTVKKLSENFSVNTAVKAVKTINLNTCTFRELLNHPYFDYQDVKLIFSYRNKMGKFISLHDLKNIEPFPEHYIRKVSPYLEVN